jgi:hypothetical protein
MKFIIFISDNIRHGNFPRVDGFQYNQDYGLYLHSGRELTAEEFNAAAKTVFDSDFRNQGFTFRPQAVEPKIVKKPEPPAPAVVVEEVSELPAAEPFLLEGRNIFHEGERVAGLFGEDAHLRVKAEHADLRPAIEAWLTTQPTP